MIARRLLVLVMALLLAAQVVRNSAVAALAELHPEKAAALWTAHPAVETSLALAQIGRDSRERKPIASSTFAMIDDASQKAPLSPQPFLVRGVQARLAGDQGRAERDFLAAQWRDPRSMAAAYFLAEHYLQEGQPLQGLRQTALAARLSPSGVAAVAPYVALYARNRANWPQIRTLFRSDPALAQNTLDALASDPANTDAVLALAEGDYRKPNSPWLHDLVQSLVTAGDYGRAHAIWAAVAGGRSARGNLLYDPGFAAPDAPPPFNWALAASPVGLAERQPGNQLHVIFYGQQDGVLASQLLLLPAGTYQLRMSAGTDAVHGELLGWSIQCDKAPLPIASTSLQGATKGWRFVVPANCPAQRLELSGTSGDVAQQADVTIGRLSLTREGGSG
jgi:hypothetical protein